MHRDLMLLVNVGRICYYESQQWLVIRVNSEIDRSSKLMREDRHES